MTANLTSKGGQYDIIWHNDDWGQLWGRYLEPVDDVPAIKKMNRFLYEPPFVWDGKDTGVAFVETIGTFFYRTDLLKEGEFPKTWDEFVKTCQRLQKDGKVKWGFAGGMKYPHGWFTFFWSIWANGGDLMLPLRERRNEELARAGWKAAIAEPEAVQAVEFWWDNIETHKIAPPGQPGYSRDDANAIFMAGDAAITAHGPVRPRDRHRVAPDERHRGHGHRPGPDRDALRPGVRRQGSSDMIRRRRK